MKIHNETMEEVNLLFEMIKTMMMTGLDQKQINHYLKRFTHYEIRNGVYINGKFIVKDIVSFNRPK